ncbi:mono-functional DNA-alkylating methyl methanesulfonate N-term-domain-containing protein [Clohesyomyces aquaticus]|uniref:Mono-functional DNA-alkylating methyl methanesulfonate N-term-domain-containing protein n=1 Tax=Clohesyomyces aquaticus TaxID=1231657 RepID=A0A1Y2A7T7_9PLEO|nr:mono-functional DNA-alkylating methyl methanesulfonate N-term-domain-containing protein [Clohesyomyces aquaticus]
MAHQFQGMVLVDGEWVSRTSDVFRAMDGARRQPDIEMNEPVVEPQHQIPQLGLLSRTVLATPIVKSILPANIRQRKLNDVVFVGENSVHLKEIRAYGHLRHVASKSDFRGRILAARVFGEPRRHEVPETDETPRKKGTVRREHGGTLMDEDTPGDQQAVPRDGAALRNGEANNLPQQVIVLTLSSRLLMFLWAKASHAGTVRFCQQTIRLPSSNSRYESLGSFLAVDPKCRAIATAAPEGRFVIYKMKCWDKWCMDVQGGYDPAPIEEERMMSLTGRIMHMEFLSPGSIDGAGKDDTHVILLFVLAHNGRTKVTCYDWDATTPLTNAKCRVKNISVESVDHNPSLLVPLNHGPDFLLISSRHITKYKNILSGDPTPVCSSIPDHILSTDHPADSKCPPLWVQWERVPRHGSNEAFYVAREDGKVIYLEIGNIGEMTISEAGNWPHPVDKAFASLDVEHELGKTLLNPDVLIAAGTTSDGHLYKIGAWMEEYSIGKSFLANNSFDFVESIPNWAPVLDLCVTALPGVRSPGQRDSIFVASGRAPHGTISELRLGLNALVDTYSEGMAGCTGLWVLGQGPQLSEEDYAHYALLIVSIPPETFVFKIFHIDAGGGTWDEGEWSLVQVPGDADEEHPATPTSDGVYRNEETLAACRTSVSTCVQITRSGARLFQVSDLRRIDSIDFEFSALAAAARPNIPLIAFALRNGMATTLDVVSIDNGMTFARGATHHLPSEPTCLEIFDIGGEPHVLVGTWEHSILIFRYHKETLHDTLRLAATAELRTAMGTSSWCESAVVVSYGSSQVLLCGLRNGHLLSYLIQTHGEGSLMLVSSCEAVIGPTAARVTNCSTDPSAAFVACGSDFCRVRCAKNPVAAPALDIDAIWFTSHQSPGFQQSAITAVDQLPFTVGQQCGKDLGSLIFAVSGDRLLYARMDYDIRWSGHAAEPSTPEPNKAVPRKLEITGTPKKLVYLEKLRKMVIATTEAREERAPPDGYRIVRSAIQLVNMADDGTESAIKQEDDIAPPKKSMIVGEFVLKNYEQVYALLDWTYAGEDGKGYHFVIAGTGIPQRNGPDVGRRLFFQVTDTTIKLKKESAFEHPVRCMAFYGANQLLTISSRALVFEEFQPTRQRWVERGREFLPSPGVHLTCSSSFIYVSTEEDSHICYEASLDPADVAKFKFNKVFTDGRQRLTAHHLNVRVDVPTVRGITIPPESRVLVRGHDPASSPLPGLTQPSTSTSGETPQEANIVLVSDKTCSLVGLYHSPKQTTQWQLAAETLFEANLPRSITRLQRGDIRPRWRRPAYYNPYPTPNPRPETHQNADSNGGGQIHGNNAMPGVLTDDIIGTCSDGTVYGFSILGSQATWVLRLLSNLVKVKKKRQAERSVCVVRDTWEEGDGDSDSDSDSDLGLGLGNDDVMDVDSSSDTFDASLDTSPDTAPPHVKAKRSNLPLITPRDVDPELQEHGPTRARAWHVDGDALSSFLEHETGGKGLQSLVDDDTEEAVQELFWNLAGALGEEVQVGGRGGENADWDHYGGKNPTGFMWVEEWVRDLLGNVL